MVRDGTRTRFVQFTLVIYRVAVLGNGIRLILVAENGREVHILADSDTKRNQKWNSQNKSC